MSARGHGDGAVTAVKLYPAHATTHSEHGVTDIAGVYPVLAAMERAGLPLLVHGEVTLKRKDFQVAEADRSSPATDSVVHFRAGETLSWTVDRATAPSENDFPEI